MQHYYTDPHEGVISWRQGAINSAAGTLKPRPRLSRVMSDPFGSVRVASGEWESTSGSPATFNAVWARNANTVIG